MRHSWDWITTGKNCNAHPAQPPACAPSESQSHKYINRQTRAHMGFRVSAGTYAPFRFFGGGVLVPQTHTPWGHEASCHSLQNNAYYTGFITPFKWTRLIHVFSTGFEAFSTTVRAGNNRLIVSSLSQPPRNVGYVERTDISHLREAPGVSNSKSIHVTSPRPRYFVSVAVVCVAITVLSQDKYKKH